MRRWYRYWFGEPYCYGQIHYVGMALRRLALCALARLPLLRLLPSLEPHGDRLLVLTFRDYKYNWFWYAKHKTMNDCIERMAERWSACLVAPTKAREEHP